MYVGVDLAGVEENPTGICRLNGDMECFTVYEDEEILKKIQGADVVAVDAPMTKGAEPFREAERTLMSKYGPMLPLNTPGMRKLSERALQLFDDVIETYPRAVEKIVELEYSEEDFETEHEYDAYLCALTARAYGKGLFQTFGREGEEIILPEG